MATTGGNRLALGGVECDVGQRREDPLSAQHRQVLKRVAEQDIGGHAGAHSDHARQCVIEIRCADVSGAIVDRDDLSTCDRHVLEDEIGIEVGGGSAGGEAVQHLQEAPQRWMGSMVAVGRDLAEDASSLCAGCAHRA